MNSDDTSVEDLRKRYKADNEEVTEALRAGRITRDEAYGLLKANVLAFNRAVAPRPCR